MERGIRSDYNFLRKAGHTPEEGERLIAVRDNRDLPKYSETFPLLADFSKYRSKQTALPEASSSKAELEKKANSQELVLSKLEWELFDHIKKNPLTRKTPSYDDGEENFYDVYKFEYVDAVGTVIIRFQEGGKNDGLFTMCYDQHDKQSDIVRAEVDSLMVIHNSSASAEGKGEPVHKPRATGVPLPDDLYRYYRNLLIVGLDAEKHSLQELQNRES